MTGLRSRTRLVRRARSARLPTAVIVPVDGSVAALSALPLAHALTQAFGAELHRATVTAPVEEPDVIDLTDTDAEPDPAEASAAPAAAERPGYHLPELWTAAHPPEVSVTGPAPSTATDHSDHLAVIEESGDRDLVLTGDSPAAALAEYSREHPDALLCIGSRARGGLHRRLVGNTTDQLLRLAACPVVAVGPRLDVEVAVGRPETILVAAGTHLPADTVPIVAAWAVMLDAEVVVAHVTASLPADATERCRAGKRPSSPLVDRLVTDFANQGIAATGYTLQGAAVTTALLGLADRLAGPVLIAAPIGPRRGRTGSDITHELLQRGRWPVLAGVGPQD